MIRLKVSGDNFEPIIHMLDRMARPPLGELAASLRLVMLEDNREGMLAQTDALYGNRVDDVTEATVRRGRGGDGPARAPRGAASRVVASYDVEIQQAPDRLLLIGSWSDAPFVRFFDAGTRRMVAREMVGIRPAGQARIAEALSEFAAGLMQSGSF
jgi:hypothetical protein